MKAYIASAVALSILVAPAFAQTATPPTVGGTESTAPKSTSPGSGASGSRGAGSNLGQSAEGIRMGDTATVALKFVTIQPASLMWSKLTGVNVYNKQNESLGEIQDLAIENGNRVAAVIVSVGGFLGIGEKYVAIDPSTIVLNQKDGNWRAYVDTSKDSLKGAPKFEYSKARS